MTAQAYLKKTGFIHSLKDVYSTSLRKLLRGAHDPSTVKNNYVSDDHRMCQKMSKIEGVEQEGGRITY